jgi:bacterioferritin-associated ferredoxin
MNGCSNSDRCDGCPGRIVCRCLQITETALVAAVETLDLRTLSDVRRATGAGQGCMCCHKRIEAILRQTACCLDVIEAPEAEVAEAVPA